VKTLILLTLVLLVHIAQATTFNSNGTPSNIQALHDSVNCHDGDTITIPAGTFPWTTKVSITKGITIIGQTTVNSDTGACNDVSILQDNIVDAQLDTGFFHANIIGNKAYRITGLTFTAGSRSTNMFNGTIRVFGDSHNVRFDHLHFTGQLKQSNGIAIYSGIYGVADHIVVNQISGQNLQNRVFNGTSPYGDLEYSQPAGYGGANFFFFDDWYVDNSGHVFGAGGG